MIRLGVTIKDIDNDVEINVDEFTNENVTNQEFIYAKAIESLIETLDIDNFMSDVPDEIKTIVDDYMEDMENE
nr:MAG TPA: hypothetical protein [Caudoviricetes sp.]